jgi:hypothetical protein
MPGMQKALTHAQQKGVQTMKDPNHNTKQKTAILNALRDKHRKAGGPSGYLIEPEWLNERGFQKGNIYGGHYERIHTRKKDNTPYTVKVFLVRTFEDLQRMHKKTILKTTWEVTQPERPDDLS